MKRTKRMLLLLMACVLSLAFGVLFSGCVVDNLGGNSGNSSSAGSGTGNVPGAGDEEEEYYIVDVQMVTPPTISEYGEGDIFDPTGMVLKVIWNDGWEQLVNDGVNCIFSPAGAITPDTEAITATYDDKVFTLPIHVNKITGIQLISQPARTLYIEGEAFSSVGLQIVTVLENGEVGKAITEYTLSENTSALSVADKKVTVSCQYQGETFTCEIPITVVSKDAVVTIEAEAGTVVGGEKVTKSSLLQYASGNSFVRNLKKGGTITINVPATKATTASLRFVASSYEDDPNGGAFAIPLKVSEYLTVTFNGEEIPLGDEAILPGGYDDERGAKSRYCHWYEVSLDDVQLNEGNNLFVITSKVDMNLQDNKDTTDVNEADLHSTLFDCLRVFYADATAIPGEPEPEEPTTLTTTIYQAERLALSGIATVIKANGDKSGLFTTMIANGDTDPGFIKDFTANSTMTLKFTISAAAKGKVSIYGSSCLGTDVTASALINKVTLNGTAVTYNAGTCFPKNNKTAQAMATFNEYVLGEFDFVAGENTLVITFNETKACFIDRLVVAPVTEGDEPEHTHSYTLETVKAEALKTEATCTSKAVYYKSCECGAISNSETFEYGEVKAHSYTLETVKAEALKTEATCTSKAVYYKSCECGAISENETFEYGEVKAHSYTLETAKAEALKTAATCTSKAVYYKSCECGAISNSETFESGEPSAHNYTLETVKDEALKTAATCTDKAVYYKSCECGAISNSETFTYGEEPAGHDFTGEWLNDKDGHWHVCENDGCNVTDTKQDHNSSGAATEDTAETCTVCEYVITHALGHTHNASEAWEYDETYHWHDCVANDGQEYDRAEHSFDNACDTSCACGYTRTVAHDFTGEWQKDETGHWHVCKTEGCGVTDEKQAHAFGKWTEVDDTYHSHACVCGKTETEEHSFDNGEITQAPTTEEEGVKTYTCTECDATQTETVEKLTEVVYEAENGVIVGGEKVTSSGLLKYMSGNSFVRNLTQGATITINVPATKATTASLRFVMSSYEDDPNGGTFTIPVQLNEYLTITFNGVEVALGDDAVLPGGADDERGAKSRYCHWYEVKLDNVQLNEGENLFVVTSKVDMSDANKDDLHSTIFDCLRVLYTDATAIPEEPEPETLTTTTYQAEDLMLSGIKTVVKANGDSSGLFTYMEATGDTDPGFVKDFTAGSTMTLKVFTKAVKVKISIYGSSTTTSNMTTATLIKDVSLNGVSQTYNAGTCFPGLSTVNAQNMAKFQEFVLGEYDFVTGDNTLVITFNATSACFIDRIVVTPVEA